MKSSKTNDSQYTVTVVVFVVILAMIAIALLAYYMWFVSDTTAANNALELHKAPRQPYDDPLKEIRKPLKQLLRENAKAASEAQDIQVYRTDEEDTENATIPPNAYGVAVFLSPQTPAYANRCITTGTNRGYLNALKTCKTLDLRFLGDDITVDSITPFLLTQESESPISALDLLPVEAQTAVKVYGVGGLTGGAVEMKADWATLVSSNTVDVPWSSAFEIPVELNNYAMVTGIQTNGEPSLNNCNNFCSSETSLTGMQTNGVSYGTVDALATSAVGQSCAANSYSACLVVLRVNT